MALTILIETGGKTLASIAVHYANRTLLTARETMLACRVVSVAVALDFSSPLVVEICEQIVAHSAPNVILWPLPLILVLIRSFSLTY